MAGLLFEDVTTAVGGTIGGRAVGTLGHAAVARLGAPLWPLSRGALIAVCLPWCVERFLAHPDLVPAVEMPDPPTRSDLSAMSSRADGFRAAARLYTSVWRGAGLPVHAVEPSAGAVSTHVEYLISVPDPDTLGGVLADEGIETRRPLTDRLRRILYDASARGVAGAREFYARTLQLPNHPGLDVEQIMAVSAIVVRHLRAPA